MSRRAVSYGVRAVLAVLLIAAIYAFGPFVREAFAGSEPTQFVKTVCVGGHEADVLTDGSIIPLPEVCDR